MDFGRLLKWAVVIAVIVVAWKVVVPWVKTQNFGGANESSTVSGGDNSCVRSAERASEAWGSGLSRFINPPYDLSAWSSFRSDVDSRIGSAESDCSCAEESCTKVQSAMRDLRSLVSDLDTAIRTGSALPSDVVQRQESIDNLINEAGDLVRAGK